MVVVVDRRPTVDEAPLVFSVRKKTTRGCLMMMVVDCRPIVDVPPCGVLSMVGRLSTNTSEIFLVVHRRSTDSRSPPCGVFRLSTDSRSPPYGVLPTVGRQSVDHRGALPTVDRRPPSTWPPFPACKPETRSFFLLKTHRKKTPPNLQIC